MRRYLAILMVLTAVVIVGLSFYYHRDKLLLPSLTYTTDSDKGFVYFLASGAFEYQLDQGNSQLTLSEARKQRLSLDYSPVIARAMDKWNTIELDVDLMELVPPDDCRFIEITVAYAPAETTLSSDQILDFACRETLEPVGLKEVI